MNIEDLGYNEFFKSNRKKLGLENFLVARVIAEHKGIYKVKNTAGEYLAKITGKQMFNAQSREDFPAVGDWVAISMLDKERAVIEGILPRKTIIKRKSSGKNQAQIIGVNIDTAFVIESVDRDYNLNRIERYFAIANSEGITTAVVLNKTDLIPKADLEIKLAEIKNRLPGTEVIPTSTKTAEGLTELKKYIVKEKTYCFLGSSGVGKSSLINKLIGNDAIKTDRLSLSTGRGKHTTTAREMYFLPAFQSPPQADGEVENDPSSRTQGVHYGAGGIVIDNPGMREVGLTDASEGINQVFDEIITLAKNCKYADCTHTHEPGCEVLLAVKSGALEKDKYTNYTNLKKEAEHYGMSGFEKRKKNRKFGKFIKKAKDGLKNYRHKNL